MTMKKQFIKKTCLILAAAVCVLILCSCEYHQPYGAAIGIDLGVTYALL